jgi:hypothetical protein
VPLQKRRSFAPSEEPCERFSLGAHVHDVGHPPDRVDPAHEAALVAVRAPTADRRWVLVAVKSGPRREVLEQAVAALVGAGPVEHHDRVQPLATAASTCALMFGDFAALKRSRCTLFGRLQPRGPVTFTGGFDGGADGYPDPLPVAHGQRRLSQ